VLQLNRVSDNHSNALNIEIILTTTHKTELALIDSGATENFIDPQTVEWLRLPITQLPHPRIINNIDGTLNQAGSVTHKCPLYVKFGADNRLVDFFVTSLGQDHIVLGFPFLKAFNPRIDWSTKTITPNQLSITPKNFFVHKMMVLLKDRAIIKARCVIEAVYGLMKNTSARKTSFAQQWSAKADKTKIHLEEVGIPSRYQRHREVFSEEGAKRLPPSRQEDMAIPFKDGAPEQLDCKVYPLSGKELDVLRANLDEDIQKGFIKHGTSSFVSPIFFIPKKDGEELRMVIDYRKLNDMTKKDFYPLPNLRTELEKLSKHRLFSKFDVRAGYNNIRIKEEDQHKAAFKTPLGTFIPTVMTFGFCNAPSIFQRAMNRDLEPLKQQYPDNFANYMDDVAIGTDNTPAGQRLHAEIVHKFLDVLALHSYFLKVSKCEFEKDEVEFLGFRLGKGSVRIDPSKIGGIADWPRELKSVKEVRQILGVLGYQRAFIQDYARLAKPLHALLKKGVKFFWTPECKQALDGLISQVTQDPVLVAPNGHEPFELETDASAYAIGAALFQKDERGKRRAVGYASRTLTAAERNYDIWDREFLGVIFGLTYWRHLLSGTKHPIKVFTDHANLLHYRHPQKVNRRIARYILTLADYNIQIQHCPGPQNRADALSRRPDYDQGEEDNAEVVPLPPYLFGENLRSAALETLIEESQEKNEDHFKRLQSTHGWDKEAGQWRKEGRLAIYTDDTKEAILKEHHDHPVAGHPGVATTYFSIRRRYWWPNMKDWIQQYVKGCGTCQQNKANTRPQKPPLYPITPEEGATPFSTIAMDWITKLPPSAGYDSILTITDHDCSKAVLLFPCKESMGTEELARLYFTKVFPHYGIPSKIISDRDPRLTSKMAKEICQEAEIDQNISTAYHPQTDGQSERTNQTLETYLRIFCNEEQNDWARWLPLAQYAMNARPSHTTKVPPFEALIGVIPRGESTPLRNESPRLGHVLEVRKRAQEAMLHSQMLLIKDNSFRAYQKGEKVWLDAKNLRTTHPTHKLRAKRYGPFKVTNALSHVAYQLQLPPTWKIHNVFHASYLSPYKETPEHGPNFLEPPPDIIGGQPEWEVEAITGMRYHGRKKQKQYRVHWKGYSHAEDSWEPEANIHAPELIAQYNRGPGITIRAAKIRTKDSMFPSSQVIPPAQSSIPSLPSSPASINTDPELAAVITAVLTERTLREVTDRLGRTARQPQTRVQAGEEELQGPRGESTQAPAVPHLGAPAPHSQTQHRGQTRTNVPRRDTPRPGGDLPRNSEEAARSRQLLRHPMVNHVEGLGRPIMVGPGHDPRAPDPPWFTKPTIPSIPIVTSVNENGETVELPYLRYALVENEPLILGTTGRDEAVYGTNLQAFPMPTLPIETITNDTALEELYTDYPFNWTLNLALYHLGDAGILADVHRYRSSFQKLQHMRSENARITRILENLQEEQKKHNTEIAAFVGEVGAIRERLVKARVMSRVAPIMRQMSIEGRIPNAFYPQVYEETIVGPQGSPSPAPPLRPTNPEPPSPLTPVVITPGDIIPELHYPSDQENQPPSVRPPTPRPPTPYTRPIPPRMDYAAGNPHGPHHQPTMFDEETSRGWPPLSSTNVLEEGRRAKMPGIHQCYYCGQRGHFNYDCSSPHVKCHDELRCLVPLNHPAFVAACFYGGRTSNNHPSHRKRRRTITSPSSQEGPTPAPSSPTANATELPPADSLLFSPNPSTPDAVIASFAPSPYQGPAPSPSRWGDAPANTTWEEFAIRNPSPCIFDYGRGGDEPIYLGGVIEEVGQSDLSGVVPLPDPTPILPRNYGVEDLSRYAEEDLPGAAYYYDDDPFAPTIHNTYRRNSVRDLGVSD
jgi:hypothetical protein